MKILIVGNGFLGNYYKNYFKAEIYPKKIRSLDDAFKMIIEECPDVVINAAGSTGRPNIDWCETHKEETLNNNVTLPLNLAQACYLKNVYFIHLGSGCIYSGNNNGNGFSEEDYPNFTGSFYSQTKIISESLISQYNPLILRIRMPITREANERDFVTKILKYKKVISAGNSVTVIDDLMELTSCLIDKRITGVFNAVNPGIMSHNQILSLYKEIVDPNLTWDNFSIEDMHKETLAKRSNCFLDTTKLLQHYNMPDINISLKKCFEYRKNHE